MNNLYSPPDKFDINIPDVLAHIRENSLLFTAKNRLYVYNETACYFAHIPKDELPRFVLSLFSQDCRGDVKTSILNEIVRRLLVLPEIDVNLNERRKEAQYLINLRNGVYSLKEKKLIQREKLPRDNLSEWCFTYCFDFEYLDQAVLERAPCYLEFLKSSLDFNTDKSKHYLQVAGKILQTAGLAAYHSAYAAAHVGYASAYARAAYQSGVRATWTFADRDNERYLWTLPAIG